MRSILLLKVWYSRCSPWVSSQRYSHSLLIKVRINRSWLFIVFTTFPVENQVKSVIVYNYYDRMHVGRIPSGADENEVRFSIFWMNFGWMMILTQRHVRGLYIVRGTWWKRANVQKTSWTIFCTKIRQTCWFLVGKWVICLLFKSNQFHGNLQTTQPW